MNRRLESSVPSIMYNIREIFPSSILLFIDHDHEKRVECNMTISIGVQYERPAT